MKHRNAAVTALAAALTVTCIGTSVFASAAPDAGQDPHQNAPETGWVYDHLGVVEDTGLTILSKGGENGEKFYSVDSGKTWMSEERYQAEYGSWGDDWQVEWWTYEDYKTWLEEEKEALQSIIGERGYTGSTGWFIWDQKMVDETVAMYEEILEKIKNGALYSKTIIDKSGNEVEDVALGSDGAIIASYVETWNGDFLLEERDVRFDAAALLEELKAFGITGDEEKLYYNGQLIRRFVDGAPVGGDGYSVQYVYANDQGTVDAHTLRSVIHNPDGSYSTMGDLIGVVTAEDENFDSELIEAAAFGQGPQMTAAGIASKDDVQAQRTVQDAVAEGTGERGMSFEEIFAQYEAYGLTYQPRESGMGALAYNGEAVRSFADLKPDGGAFSYQDPYTADGLRVYAEYDQSGKLTGLRAV